MKRFKVAVIGSGFIGPVHVEGLRRAGQDVVGISDITHDRAQAAASTLGIPKAYPSYEAALEDPEVESVHIATPNKLHYKMVAQAVEAGKHVVCEKPLAMNAQESATLAAMVAGKPIGAAVNYNLRFYPLALEARDRIAKGEYGSVHSVIGSYVQDWLLFDTDYNWRVLAAEGGELRAVSDIGTHWLDLVQFVTGSHVVAVCADLQTNHKVRKRPLGEVETFTGKMKTEVQLEPVDITTDDQGAIMLRFDNGATGVLWVSQMTAGRKNCLRYEIGCSTAALAFESERPNTLWIGHRTGPNEQLLRDPSLLGEVARSHADYPGGHNEGFPDTFKQMFRSFYTYLAKGDFSAPKPFATFEDGHREILLCDAILLSHREKRWVKVIGATR